MSRTAMRVNEKAKEWNRVKMERREMESLRSEEKAWKENETEGKGVEQIRI